MRSQSIVVSDVDRHHQQMNEIIQRAYARNQNQITRKRHDKKGTECTPIIKHSLLGDLSNMPHAQPQMPDAFNTELSSMEHVSQPQTGNTDNSFLKCLLDPEPPRQDNLVSQHQSGSARSGSDRNLVQRIHQHDNRDIFNNANS